MASEITLTGFTADAISALEGGAEHFVEAVAVRIRDEFQSNVHVITGAMQASASVITAEHSDYAANVATAAALNPAAAFAPEEPVGPGEAIVQVPVNYAAYEELGTVNRPAHPALIPAVESAVASADAIVREVFGI